MLGAPRAALGSIGTASLASARETGGIVLIFLRSLRALCLGRLDRTEFKRSMLSFGEASLPDDNLDKILRFPAIHPIDIKLCEVTSGFGKRRDPYTRRYRMHDGQDFSGKRADIGKKK